MTAQHVRIGARDARVDVAVSPRDARERFDRPPAGDPPSARVATEEFHDIVDRSPAPRPVESHDLVVVHRVMLRIICSHVGHGVRDARQKRSFAAPNDPESRLAAANVGHRHGRRRSRPFFRSIVALTVSTCTYRAVGRPPVSNCGVGPRARSPPVRLPARSLRSKAPRTVRHDRVPRA